MKITFRIIFGAFCILFCTKNLFAQKKMCAADTSEKFMQIQTGFPAIGVGLVRNQITPVMDFNVMLRWKTSKHDFKIGPGISVNYFFEKDSNGYHVFPNTFGKIEFFMKRENSAKILSDSTKNNSNSNRWFSIGVSYLLDASGDYFNGTTVKLFWTYDLGKVNLSPELIITDDWKTFFPGIKITF